MTSSAAHGPSGSGPVPAASVSTTRTSPTPAGSPAAGGASAPGSSTGTGRVVVAVPTATVPVRAHTALAHPPAADQAAVADAISAARFATYLRYAVNVDSRAWAAYAWNTRVSAAMLQVMTHAEVALRNAVSRALVAAFGAGWPYEKAFEFTFSKFEQQVYRQARGELERRLKKTSPLPTGDFVAGQTLVFWESLLVRRLKQRVWDAQFATAFPGATHGETYRDVYAAAEQLRRVRNRIAHHEPLLTIPLLGVYARAIAVIGWVSPAKATWVQAEWPPVPEFAGPP